MKRRNRCKSSVAMTIKWRKYTGLTHISVSFPWELHFYNSFRMWEGKHKRGGKYSRHFWQKLQFCGCMLALFQPGWYQGEDEVGIWNLVEIACVWMICMRIVSKKQRLLKLETVWYIVLVRSPVLTSWCIPVTDIVAAGNIEGVITITLFCLRVKVQVGLPNTKNFYNTS